jgi:GTP-binding protein HflX
VDAFRATLEETSNAALLLHVVDASDPSRRDNIESVETVLREIAADQIPQLLVYNKTDRMDNVFPKLERDEQGNPVRVWLSAKTGEGIGLLWEAVAGLLSSDILDTRLRLLPNMANIRALLYQSEAVLSEEITDQGEFLVHVRMPKSDWAQLEVKNGVCLEDFR